MQIAGQTPRSSDDEGRPYLAELAVEQDIELAKEMAQWKTSVIGGGIFRKSGHCASTDAINRKEQRP